MRLISLVAVTTLSALAIIPSAQADTFSVSAVGALNISKLSIDPEVAGVTLGSGTTFGFGALAGMSVMPMMEVETGLLYMPRKTTASAGILSGSTSIKQLEIPLLVRFTGLPFVSFGLGGYLGLGLGDVSSHNDLTGVDTSLTYDASQTSKTDLGLLGSIAVKFPVAPMISLLADARYLWGLKNVDTDPASTSTTKLRDFQILAGVNFSL